MLSDGSAGSCTCRGEANLFPLEYEKDDEDDRLFKDHDHDVKGTLSHPGPTLQRVSCRDREVLSHMGPGAE